MAVQVSKSEFKARALEYFRKVEASGEPLVITDHGRPSLELRKIAEDVRDPFEVLNRSVLRYDRPLDPVDEEEWEALK
jgi:antitoxin (DNA-binding transcriptional repressor) of toxin-antitoxin stability system